MREPDKGIGNVGDARLLQPGHSLQSVNLVRSSCEVRIDLPAKNHCLGEENSSKRLALYFKAENGQNLLLIGIMGRRLHRKSSRFDCSYRRMWRDFA